MTEAPERIWAYEYCNQIFAARSPTWFPFWADARAYVPDRADLPAAVTVKPLEWSDVREPDGGKTSFYTHVVAQTPLGQLCIEWKGWKKNDTPTCTLPWPDKFVCGRDLDDCKAKVQRAIQEVVYGLVDTTQPDPVKDAAANPVAEALDKAANEAIQGYVERTDRFSAGFRVGLSKMKEAALRALAEQETGQ